MLWILWDNITTYGCYHGIANDDMDNVDMMDLLLQVKNIGCDIGEKLWVKNKKKQ